MIALPSPHPAIRCLVQSTAVHPDLTRSAAPPGLLAQEELSRFEAFRVPKRRHDWLIGRWTAKHLVRRYLAESGAAPPPLNAILVLADPDGAPYAACAGTGGVERLPVSLSISHSGEHGFCALSNLDQTVVGVDIEAIEPRPVSLVEHFFTDEEHAAVRRAEPEARDQLITLMWCGKEAILKALRLGLRADTRRVRGEFGALAGTQSWQSVRVWVDPALQRDEAQLSLWWCVRENYVLTVALLRRA
jgi:4'-phosphopantetheinyl transferase